VNQKTSIVHVITGLDTGGAEHVLASLALEKMRVGEHPLVVSLVDGGSQFDKLRTAGCRVIGLGMRRGRPSFKALMRLVRIIKCEKPPVIQSWMYHADIAALLAVYLSGRRSCTKLFWGIRCSDMDGSRYRYLRGVCSWLSKYPDGIIANSYSGLKFHTEVLGYRPKRTAVIPNFFDTERYCFRESARSRIRRELGLDENDFVIAAVARVDAMKDYPNFLSALEEIDGVTALAIGKGTETLPVTQGLIVLGERDDIPDLLSAIDVLVSASAFGEGFSNVIGEAMACQRAVIATNVGDANSLVGSAGIIVPPSSPFLLARAIARLQHDEKLARSMGHLGRERIIAEYRLERAVAAFQAVYGYCKKN
tara:strand:- start:10953 stop:12047 length:1095 start_codon:yes stop_codon:yes gene_type:complete